MTFRCAHKQCAEARRELAALRTRCLAAGVRADDIMREAFHEGWHLGATSKERNATWSADYAYALCHSAPAAAATGGKPARETDSLWIIVNGENWRKSVPQSNTLGSIKAQVLADLHHTGRAVDDWEFRDAEGRVLGESDPWGSLGVVGPMFLSLSFSVDFAERVCNTVSAPPAQEYDPLAFLTTQPLRVGPAPEPKGEACPECHGNRIRPQDGWNSPREACKACPACGGKGTVQAKENGNG